MTWQRRREPARTEGPLRRAVAPAKVNLTLAVLGTRRPDGFHELRGVFARLELADEIAVRTVDKGPTWGGDLVSVRGSGTVGVSGRDDLSVKAAQALRAATGRPLPRLRIAIRKRIPFAAGLAGGSSDAAATLRLAVRVWGLDVGADELARAALDLGSDVPFFLGASPAALVEGRGEKVRPLPAAGIAGTGVLLVCREGKPSTAEVFDLHDADSRPPDGALAATDRLVRLLEGGEATPSALVDLAAALRDANDLFPAAARVTVGLAEWRERIERILGRPALLSGAGPTLFSLYVSAAEAKAALPALRAGLGRQRQAGELAVNGGAALPAAPRLIATAIAAH